VPTQFIVACSRNHLDEFPWPESVHKDGPRHSTSILEAVDLGTLPTTIAVLAKCRKHLQ